LKIDYPVAIDNGYAIWKAFNNEYWPAAHFVDAEGRIATASSAAPASASLRSSFSPEIFVTLFPAGANNGL